MKIIFEEFENEWLAYFEKADLADLVETANTKQEVFNELMIH